MLYPLVHLKLKKYLKINRKIRFCKVCSVLNDSSSQSCHLCGTKISKMNLIDKMVHNAVNKSALQYGIPVLHAHIRFLELVLHISYRLSCEETKVWMVRTAVSN